MEDNVITVKIERFNPKVDDSSKYQTYKVKTDKVMTAMVLVKYIHDNLDRTLAYRYVKCFLGVCTACLMNINGKNLRGCSYTVSPGDELTIGPARKYGVIRDLVIDFGVMREQIDFEAIDESVER